jgi:molybdopterin-dependent oxidoreductase iron-sulfur protein
MSVEVEDGKLKTVSGDKDNPDSKGFLCVRGGSTNDVAPTVSRSKSKQGQEHQER